MLCRVIKLTKFSSPSSARFYPGFAISLCNVFIEKLVFSFFQVHRVSEPGAVEEWEEHLERPGVRTPHLMEKRKCMPTHFCTWVFYLPLHWTPASPKQDIVSSWWTCVEFSFNSPQALGESYFWQLNSLSLPKPLLNHDSPFETIATDIKVQIVINLYHHSLGGQRRRAPCRNGEPCGCHGCMVPSRTLGHRYHEQKRQQGQK